VACRTHVFLFDLLALEQPPKINSETVLEQHGKKDEEVNPSNNVQKAFSDLLVTVLSSPDIIKIGFGLYGDFKRLLSSFPSSQYYEFSAVENVHDLSNVAFCKVNI
jgi:hypothetical protein